MQIGELATKVGINIQTIRFYERKKLLPSPARKPSGYRVYSDEDLRRLRFIRQAKALGFSLDEVREILRLRTQGACPCGRVIDLGAAHLREIRQTIRRLSAFERELTQALKKWKSAGQQKLSGNEFCALIERTMEAAIRKKGC